MSFPRRRSVSSAYLLGLHSADQGGFTLIELLVAIIMVGALAVIGIPTFLRYLGSAREAQANVHLSAVNRSQQAYRLQKNSFANSLSLLGLANADDDYVYTIAVASGSHVIVEAQPQDASIKGFKGVTYLLEDGTDSAICEGTSGQVPADCGASEITEAIAYAATSSGSGSGGASAGGSGGSGSASGGSASSGSGSASSGSGSSGGSGSSAGGSGSSGGGSASSGSGSSGGGGSSASGSGGSSGGGLASSGSGSSGSSGGGRGQRRVAQQAVLAAAVHQRVDQVVLVGVQPLVDQVALATAVQPLVDRVVPAVPAGVHRRVAQAVLAAAVRQRGELVARVGAVRRQGVPVVLAAGQALVVRVVPVAGVHQRGVLVALAGVVRRQGARVVPVAGGRW
jgi:prepilin-type N-terminal cleavage/methylation domain-containing protein